MQSCHEALRALQGIAMRLDALGAFGNEQGLQSEQINVVRLVQESDCPVLKVLSGYVRGCLPERVLFAWKALVVEGLEPYEPTLQKVAEIQARSASGTVRVVSTNSPSRADYVAQPMNLWIEHARQVVAVLITWVERKIAAPTCVADRFAAHDRPTGRDLSDAVGISDDTFRRIRSSSGLEAPLKGAAARNRRYSANEVDQLIGAAIGGTYVKRSEIVEKWMRWGSKCAAGKPQFSK